MKIAKTIIKLVSMLTLSVLFFSCATTNEATSTEVQSDADSTAAEKVIGAEGVERPNWVLLGKKSLSGLYGVGAAKLDTKEESLEQARSVAIAELKASAQETIKIIERAQTNDDNFANALTALESSIVSENDKVTQNAEQEDYWVSNEGIVYVLMYLPYDSIVKSANESITAYSQAKNVEIKSITVADILNLVVGNLKSSEQK